MTLCVVMCLGWTDVVSKWLGVLELGAEVGIPMVVVTILSGGLGDNDVAWPAGVQGVVLDSVAGGFVVAVAEGTVVMLVAVLIVVVDLAPLIMVVVSPLAMVDVSLMAVVDVSLMTVVVVTPLAVVDVAPQRASQHSIRTR